MSPGFHFIHKLVSGTFRQSKQPCLNFSIFFGLMGDNLLIQWHLNTMQDRVELVARRRLSRNILNGHYCNIKNKLVIWLVISNCLHEGNSMLRYYSFLIKLWKWWIGRLSSRECIMAFGNEFSCQFGTVECCHDDTTTFLVVAIPCKLW